MTDLLLQCPIETKSDKSICGDRVQPADLSALVRRPAIKGDIA